MVVDDDPLVRNLLRAVLQSGEFDVIEAVDGKEALRLAGERAPNVVVLDVMMPGASGYDVCRSLRADPRFDGTRIVMLTARNSVDDREEGMAAGADAFFTKPFSPLQLIDTVLGARDGAA